MSPGAARAAAETTANPRHAEPLLALRNLEVTFPGEGGRSFRALRGVSFSVGRGEMVGLVGESGSGKSLIALSTLGLVPPPARVSGHIELEGRDLLALSAAEMRPLRGARVAMVFQDPMTALHPAYSIGFQVAETVRAHSSLTRRQARARGEELLRWVALPEPTQRWDDYPHQLSGGQQQRVLIAMALAGKPELLFADEPTTALDVTVQAQILELLARLRRELGMAVVLISHDLAVVAETCDRVLVLYAGQIVEEAVTEELFATPEHPYTRALLATLPRLGRPHPRGALPVLEGQPAEMSALPPGCTFHPRCSVALGRCRSEAPALLARPGTGVGRRVRCWLYPGEEPRGER